MKTTKRLWIFFLAAGLLMGSVSCEKGELPSGTSGAGQEYSTVTETKETTSETQIQTVTSEMTKTESETEEPKETYAEYAKVLKRKASNEITYASNDNVYSTIKNLFGNKDLTVGTLHRKTLAEKVFEVGMEYFYLYQDMEKAELIFDCLFAVINREEYSVPELEGIDVKEAFSWRYSDSNTGVERVIDYREFMIDSMNMYFRRAANQVLVPETGISGYMLFLKKVVPFPYQDQLDSYTLNATTFTVENFPETFEQVQAERQKDPDFWKNLKHGDLVFLGRYEQDNNLKNGAEPILWEVMDWSEDGRMYLQSCAAMRYMVWTEGDCEKDPTQVYWENSLIRTWLNGEFYEGAFSAEEKALIQTAKLDNDWYDGYNGGIGGLGGNDTEDRVFVHSMREVFGDAPYDHYYEVDHKIPNEYAKATAPPVEEYQISDRNQTWYRQFGVQKMYDGYFNFPRAVRAAVLIQIPNA